MSKILTDLARQRCLNNADRAVRECGECGGRCYICGGGPASHLSFCSRTADGCAHCQPIAQSWRDKADEYRVHDPDVIEGQWKCECGATGQGYYEATCHFNEHTTTLTVELIRKILVDLGEWEGFIITDHPVVITGTIGEDAVEGFTVDSLSVMELADILTDPELLIQAAISYLEVE